MAASRVIRENLNYSGNNSSTAFLNSLGVRFPLNIPFLPESSHFPSFDHWFPRHFPVYSPGKIAKGKSNATKETKQERKKARAIHHASLARRKRGYVEPHHLVRVESALLPSESVEVKDNQLSRGSWSSSQCTSHVRAVYADLDTMHKTLNRCRGMLSASYGLGRSLQRITMTRRYGLVAELDRFIGRSRYNSLFLRG